MLHSFHFGGIIFHTVKPKICCFSSKVFLRTKMKVLTEKSLRQTKCKVDKRCKGYSAGLLEAFLLVLCLEALDDKWSWEINILTFWEPRYVFCGEAWSHPIRLWNHDLLSQRARKLLKKNKNGGTCGEKAAVQLNRTELLFTVVTFMLTSSSSHINIYFRNDNKPVR